MVARTQSRKKTASKKVVAPVTAADETKKVVTGKAAAPKNVNAHIEAGLENVIDGSDTPLMNDNRPTKIEVRDSAKMTDRRQKGLYMLRKCYGNKPFIARGLNHGVLRTLLANGLIEVTGGQRITEGSKTYLVDGETQVVCKLTPAGQKYGLAA